MADSRAAHVALALARPWLRAGELSCWGHWGLLEPPQGLVPVDLAESCSRGREGGTGRKEEGAAPAWPQGVPSLLLRVAWPWPCADLLVTSSEGAVGGSCGATTGIRGGRAAGLWGLAGWARARKPTRMGGESSLQTRRQGSAELLLQGGLGPRAWRGG